MSKMNAIITKKMQTNLLDVAAIERGEIAGWVEILERNVAVKAMMSMVVVDALPETLEDVEQMYGE